MTAPDRLSLAVRVMKARWTGTCPACSGPVLVGHRIARLTDPDAWIHVRCVPAVRRLAAITTEERPA